ncbi:endoplasmic reticulum membrane sensor NFE2L1-like isoform X2 [Polyodon spathula]|uniref:endoplasmic reticulum membrane sensor NFE2L1-like isoform X1 n=1 Tax=Polyodon spathula TaxID=7913 RepID=UPI001B7EA5F2|nr:endoplasmic reticulum membrane sensor NFE2L1-like isoform X1 [Polyodon spathula]XP_041087752.1 endoplasmic reticulum membrane sensor NFE2L1-like isoform X2 [Polyodon spathula]XP_041087753.1 endoplasmic reticulum membrane sensor NFE2L1-like isoform X2 [Polyodon spathula]
MLYLKKYLTEGLIQFTILLSLIGVRVDVDTYLSAQLPPLREIILGPSSAYTQTQFHNLRNTLDGYGLHPKSVDLDCYFTSRWLLGEVRSLDRLQVPSTELSAWLAYRDTEGPVVSSPQSGSGGGGSALENASGVLEEMGNLENSAVRGNGTLDQGYGQELEENLGAVAPGDSSELNDDSSRSNLTKEDIDLIDILWRQDIDLGAGREVFDYSSRQKENKVEKRPSEEEEERTGESWRNSLNQGQGEGPVDGETGESIPQQLHSLVDQTSPSLQECLSLLEATFPFVEETEFPGSVYPELEDPSEAGPSTSSSQGPLLSPLLSQTDSPLDREQQWQDIMAIMDLQDMEINEATDPSFNTSTSSSGVDTGSLADFSFSAHTPINQDVSLHQASLPSCNQDFPGGFYCPELGSCPMEDMGTSPPASLLHLSSSNSSNIDSTFGAPNLTDVLLPPQLNGSANGTGLQDPLAGLLEEALLDEISLLDLALVEGFNPAQASRLREEFDSDSGLSLDFSRSPASPSGSETSSSSSSSSSTSSFSEEGAVGYSTDSEAVDFEEGGAVGGCYQPEFSKFCRMSYQDPSRFSHLPQLEHVAHNHTYNLAPSHPDLPSAPGKKSAGREKQQQQQDLLDKQQSRDERRARAMKIPFSNEKIVHLPVEEFNELLSKHQLSEAQLALVRDIRRRGKNKMAAQNCRKRKLDTILNLERGVEALRRDKARLLREKVEFVRSLRQMKQKMQSLHQEVFSRLRDESGRPYPAGEFSLQYGSDGSVLLVPRSFRDEQQQPSRKPEKKPKDKKK